MSREAATELSPRRVFASLGKSVPRSASREAATESSPRRGFASLGKSAPTINQPRSGDRDRVAFRKINTIEGLAQREDSLEDLYRLVDCADVNPRLAKPRLGLTLTAASQLGS